MKCKIELPAIISIAGSTMCGKSYLARQLLKKDLKDQYDYLFIFSSTLKLNNDWEQDGLSHNEDKGIFHYDSDIIETIKEIVKRQKFICENYKKKEVPAVMVVLDDLAGENIFDFRSYLDNIALKIRHYNISLMIISQRISAIGRTLRLNSKYFILFSCFSLAELESFLDQFVMKKDKKILHEKIDEIYREKYNFIFTDNFQPNMHERLWQNGKDLIKLINNK